MMVSDNITLKEATRTSVELPNMPGAEHIKAMRALAVNIFEPLRSAMGGEPIIITSFYRSIAVNKRVGGSATSQHTEGEAMDIRKPGMNKKMFDYIKSNLEFDQLIWEFGNDFEPDWVHVSFTLKRKNRKQVLKAKRTNGKTKYIPYE